MKNFISLILTISLKTLFVHWKCPGLIMIERGKLLYSYQYRNNIVLIAITIIIILTVFIVTITTFISDFLLKLNVCWITIYYICGMFLLLYENPLRIYENGIEIPKAIITRFLEGWRTYFSGKDIEAIYPEIFKVLYGPGWDNRGRTGLTTWVGLRVELNSKKSYLLKFRATSENTNTAYDDCIKAMITIRKMYKKNNWILIKNPPKLNIDDFHEYQQADYGVIFGGNIKNIRGIEGFSMVIIFGSMFGLYFIFKAFNVQITGGIMLIILFISVSPMFILAYWLILKEQKRKEKTRLFLKYAEHQLESDQKLIFHNRILNEDINYLNLLPPGLKKFYNKKYTFET